MIECKNIKKSFKQNKVIRGVNLKLRNKKITSLIGKNGAGKSTLINLIVGYYKLDGGSIVKDNLSVMPDADNMYSSWTGLEFLRTMSKIKGAEFSKTLEMAEKLGLSSKLKQKISSYSFGMKKKLSFIQCAIGTYETYIFDEPTSGVDVPSALIMLEIVQTLKETNAAILLTSHNIDELERVSDYVYLLDSGKIIKEGTVSSFIGMNHKTIFYNLTSPSAKEISTFSLLKPYIHKIDESKKLIELAFTTEAEAMSLLKEITLKYPVLEYYRKKESLIQSIYSPSS